MTTHGEKRLGLLTSSRASVIMRGSDRAWASLRDEMWLADGQEFDNKSVGGAREYGHVHEEDGVAKFWEHHPEYGVQPFGPDGKPPFFVYRMPKSPLDGWLASSPDRILIDGIKCHGVVGGLEVKSPTSIETFDKHTLSKHMDQCQHGMLVTGLPEWWLAIHHENLYKDFRLIPNKSWRKSYLSRAEKFLAYCYEGRDFKRRRLTAADL